MGYEQLEVCLNEEGALKVRDHKLRLLPREDLELHRVDARADCSLTVVYGAHEATFNDFLQVFFLVTLGLGVINIALYSMADYTRLSWYSQTRLCGAALLAIFVAVGFVMRLERKMTRNTGAARPRRKEMKKKKSHIQHV